MRIWEGGCRNGGRGLGRWVGNAQVTHTEPGGKRRSLHVPQDLQEPRRAAGAGRGGSGCVSQGSLPGDAGVGGRHSPGQGGEAGRSVSQPQLWGPRTTLTPPEAGAAWERGWTRRPPLAAAARRQEDKGRPSIEKSRLARSPVVPWQLGLK